MNTGEGSHDLPVRIDPQLCRGHARCIALAPDAFDYDEVTDQAVILPQAADTDADLLELVLRSCPEGAISRTAAGA